MICNDDVCNCAIVSSTLDITGSGTAGDPLVIEQSEFSDLAAIQSDIANINAELDTLPTTYVNTTGDAMTGAVKVTVGSGASVALVQTGADTPYLEWRRADNTRVAFMQAGAALLVAQGDAGMGFIVRTNGNNERMRVESDGDVFMHKSATGIATVGQEFGLTGQITHTVDTVGVVGMIANRTGGANADNQVYLSIRQANTQIGRIERASVTSATYTASSDKDLKENIQPIPDELALLWLRLVDPVFFTERADPEHKQRVGYIAQDVDAVWPNGTDTGVISRGHGNAEDRTWDDLGNETTPDEVWEPWGVAYERAGVYVHAASKVNDRRLTDLEERVTALEGGKPKSA